MRLCRHRSPVRRSIRDPARLRLVKALRDEPRELLDAFSACGNAPVPAAPSYPRTHRASRRPLEIAALVRCTGTSCLMSSSRPSWRRRTRTGRRGTAGAACRLALATILQAYTRASDHEAIEATVMDRRSQLVLDCMNAEELPFRRDPGRIPRADRAEPGPALVERMWSWPRDRGFGARALRAALDSSRCGGRPVEDT